MKKLLLVLTVALLTFGITACKPGEDPEDPVDPEVTAPVIEGVEDVDITVGDDFDPMDGVSATDEVDGDLTGDIEVSGTVDTDMAGDYTVTYSVTNSGGKTATESRTVTVSDLPVTYPNGFYNYKFATSELRNTLFAAAERYLLETLSGGIPMFDDGGYALYSGRLQLPVDEYVAVMGYGTSFASMSEDDSTVLMDDGQYGNPGEYTWRGALTDNPTTFFHWEYDDAVSADAITWMLDAPYVYVFNDEMNGYDLAPSMASDMPQPVDEEVTETGMTVAKVWEIPIREGLEWTYHEDVEFDTSGWDNTIDAFDFEATYRKALEEEWFRAVSGGGDFLNQATAIQNAAEFVEGTVDWDAVGIKALDANTLELSFVQDMSEWNVSYFLSSFVMTPVQMDLYDALTVDDQSTYGTAPEKMAFNGAYTMTFYAPDQIARYEKNPNYHNPDLYFFTHLDLRILPEATIRWQEFLAGKLESVGVPPENYEQVQNDPRLKAIPGATVYRMMINGLGTQEAFDAKFPDTDYTPEPILANDDFKKALYFALDRDTLATEIMKRGAAPYYFTDAYFVDPATGVPFRNTEQGQAVAANLSPSTYGYAPDLAGAYWDQAIDALVADGTYSPGDVITLDYIVYADSDTQVLMGEFIRDSFESIFVSEEHDISVELTITPTAFPDLYYDFMMIGKFDLSIGAISGSTLDAASFLDVFADDNRGGFTLNWGIDTSTANIEVEYYNPYLEENVREMWSFNAITSVLNGEKFIADGAEASVPAAKDFEYPTPTSVSFTVSQFSNTSFENITYTLEYYDLAAGYLPVEGHVDVPVTSAEVLIDGLDPYWDYIGAYAEYYGDYQVTINFDYVGEDKEGSSTAPWWPQPTVIDSYEQTADTETSATVSIVVNETDYAREITSAQVLDGALAEVAGAVIDFADEAAISVTGLEAGTTYYIVFTFDDGYKDYVAVTTTALAE